MIRSWRRHVRAIVRSIRAFDNWQGSACRFRARMARSSTRTIPRCTPKRVHATAARHSQQRSQRRHTGCNVPPCRSLCMHMQLQLAAERQTKEKLDRSEDFIAALMCGDSECAMRSAGLIYIGVSFGPNESRTVQQPTTHIHGRASAASCRQTYLAAARSSDCQRESLRLPTAQS